MPYYYKTFFLIGFFSCFVSAQNYIWPTNASNLISSSFGEFRQGHFHTGLDIKTWKKKGFKVFAIDSGYVWRIKTSPFGYGRSIYVKFPDGNIVLYAHLQKYNPKLNGWVEQQQEREGRYSIDTFFKPGEFPVQKGQVIAYTGDTGAGPPHLHVEVRNERNYPLNPLKNGLKITDHIPPTFKRFAVVPLGVGAQINGDYEPKIFFPRRVERGEYELMDTLQVYGRLGFSVEATDLADGAFDRFCVYQFRLFIDDSLWFQTTFNRLSFDENNQIYLAQNYRLMRWKEGKFSNLFILDGNTLPFYPEENGLSKINTGVVNLNLKLGIHRIRVEARDTFNNFSKCTGIFIYGQKKIFDLPVNISSSEIFTLRIPATSPWKNLFVFRSEEGRNWQPLYGNLDNKTYSFHLSQKYNFLKLVALDTLGILSYPKFLGNTPVDTNFQFTVAPIFYETSVTFLIETQKPQARIPAAELQNPKRSLPLIPMDSNHFFTVIELDTSKTYQLFFRLGNQEKKLTFSGRVVEPSKDEWIFSEDDTLGLFFPRGSLFQKTFIHLEKVELKESKEEIISPAYQISPFDVPVASSIDVVMKLNKNITHPRSLGVFALSEKGWTYAGSRMDTVKNIITGKLKEMETVAILRDSIPPEIKEIRPGSGFAKSTPLISAWIKDELAGINTEEQIGMWLDGHKVPCEYDPEANRIWYQVKKKLAKGNHILKIEATDNIGNKAEQGINFNVH